MYRISKRQCSENIFLNELDIYLFAANITEVKNDKMIFTKQLQKLFITEILRPAQCRTHQRDAEHRQPDGRRAALTQALLDFNDRAVCHPEWLWRDARANSTPCARDVCRAGDCRYHPALPCS